jgi:hypothetical protein
MKGMGPVRTGVENCQRVLDYIKANPGATTPHIAAAMEWTPNATNKRLRRMAERGEVRDTHAMHESTRLDGTRSVQRTFAYVALVDRTRSIEETITMLRQNLPATEAKAAKQKKPPEPKWRTVNKRFDDQFAKPYPNQGGQGALRRDVTVQSSSEMI